MTKTQTQEAHLSPLVYWTLLLCPLWCALAWDAAGLDLVAAQWFGTVKGFPLQDHWFFTDVMHTAAKWPSWVVGLWVIVGIWWPTGWLTQLHRRWRIQLVVSLLLALAATSTLKHFSHSSCPWELQSFGGQASYVSHWMWRVDDGGSGRCFPAGHASAGFAFMGGYFAFAHTNSRQARLWLFGAVAYGLILGLAQQIRGAHFMSHTLWTACICWMVGMAIDTVVQRRQRELISK